MKKNSNHILFLVLIIKVHVLFIDFYLSVIFLKASSFSNIKNLRHSIKLIKKFKYRLELQLCSFIRDSKSSLKGKNWLTRLCHCLECK